MGKRTSWKRGQSGNPSGRPRKTPDLIEVETLARQASPMAIKRLIEWMEADNPKASIAACNAILDRAWGKPAQAIEHSGRVSHDLSSLSDADLMAIITGKDGGRSLN
jgi:hypothetical protein